MKKTLVIAAVSALWALPMTVFAHGSCKDGDMEHCAYWHNSDGVYINDSSGKCVRTSSWFKGSQVEGCDEIMKAAEPAPMAAAMAPIDSDGDGVTDDKDACPNTPTGAAVDGRGCLLDSDGDGVADMNDQCPGTPKGAEVDAKGCKVVKYEAVSVKLDVKFASNADKVTAAYETQMKALAYVVAANPNAKVVINGHTDSVGAAAYNQDLSQRRAEAVAQYLIDNYGVAPNQISAVGHGEEVPLADNKTAEGRLANRRVEAEIQGQVKK
ncbi:MAG: OmpA family protein [Halopseudomonas sp.]